jgi:GT2 family glycosyltransferase
VPTLTAIVPATDAPPTLGACLAAIQAATDAPEQVVVVTEGDGPADARNAGAREAAGDILVFVDSDVLPHIDAFARIRAAFDADPDLAAVFGSYDDRPAAPGVISAFRNLLHHHIHQQGAGVASTFWAGLGAVRADVFAEAGGFDAGRYPLPSIEDIELGSRLVASDRKIALDPTVQGTHLKAWTLPSMVRTDLWRRGVPWVELLLGRGASSGALNLGWRHRASALASVIVAGSLLRGRPKAAAGWLAILVALNPSFYRLLLRRGGPAQAVAGVGLHAVHHVTGALSVPVAVLRHFGSER